MAKKQAKKTTRRKARGGITVRDILPETAKITIEIPYRELPFEGVPGSEFKG